MHGRARVEGAKCPPPLLANPLKNHNLAQKGVTWGGGGTTPKLGNYNPSNMGQPRLTHARASQAYPLY